MGDIHFLSDNFLNKNSNNNTEMSENNLNVIIAAGGTGGHIFPALAVAEQLDKLVAGYVNFTFIGSADRMESKLVPEMGYEYHSIEISGYSGLSFSLFKLPFKIYKAIRKCRQIIRDKHADVVLAAGSYISYPPGAAAAKEKVPLALMEANVNPGKAIKMLANRAGLIFTSFRETEQYFNPSVKQKLRYFGNPVRKDILNMTERKQALEKFELAPDKKTILVFGGSLGARSINEIIEKMLPKLEELDVQVIWQTGKTYDPPDSPPQNIKIHEFIKDMASAYAAADLVVSRSGATTVAEICIAGKPSILVPLPAAANNEQYENARILAEKNAAILIDNDKIKDKLYTTIKQMIKDPKMLENYGNNALQLGTPDAAENCAREILNFLKRKN